MRRLYLLMLLLLSGCLMCNDAMAQDERIQEKPRYVIETDSQFIKATPYERVVENGIEVQRYTGGKAEWYTDMTIRSFLPKKADENGMKMMSGDDTVKPTIFLLSGGAFAQLDNQEELDPDNTNLATHPNLKLATKLANEGYNVFWIDYQIAIGANNSWIKKLIINPFLTAGCSFTNGSRSKAILEYESLASFRDFRVKFQDIIDNTANKVDTNNVFISGISAGAVLAIYSVFLEGSEMPTSIPFVNCSGVAPSDSPISVTSDLKTDGYPMPKIRGIIPMAGAVFYSDIFNHTSHSDSVYINMMHGTCDELINQDTGRVAYKNLSLTTEYNRFDLYRYPYANGSKYIYNQLLSTGYQKIGFGQVIRGGHNVIGSSVLAAGGWDVYEKSNSSSKYNSRDIVFDNISLFMKRVMGEASPAWTNHAYSVFPDVPTTLCLDDNQTLIAPPIITIDSVCGTVAAAVSNPPAWATITWTVSTNLQIVGTSTGAAISYKSLSTGSGWVRASVNYGGGVVIPVTKNVLVPSTCPTPCNGILYYDNQTVGINTNIIHCGNIHSQNVKVNTGVSLVLDATGYVFIHSNFEVPLNATLDINP